MEAEDVRGEKEGEVRANKSLQPRLSVFALCRYQRKETYGRARYSVSGYQIWML